MSRYRYRHNNNIIDIKINNKIENIHEDYYKTHQSTFKNITSSIFKNLKSMFLDMRKPEFKNRQADRVLDSKDYNQNILEINKDFRVLYNQLNSLQTSNKENVNYNNIYNDFLNASVDAIKEKSDSVQVYIKHPFDKQLIIEEDFTDFNSFSQKTDALIHGIDGKVTLSPSGVENNIDKATEVEILDSSNGFPGNMHKVKVEGEGRVQALSVIDIETEEAKTIDESERKIKFYSEENPRIHAASIVDGDDETWFEYELCNFPAAKKEDPCEFYGLEYECGTTWAKDPEEGYLRLHLQFTLPEPIRSNFLSVVPHQFPFEGAGEVQLKKVRVGKTNTSSLETLYDSETEGNIHTFEIENELVQVIDLVFEQHSPYDAPIGHIYYERKTTVDTTKTSWFGLRSKTEREVVEERIEGPKQDLEGLMEHATMSLEQVALSGLAGGAAGFAAFKLGASLGSVLGPVGSIAAGVVAGIITKLWGDTKHEVVDDVVEAGIEKFDGWRWAIGVRDVALNTITYEPYNELLTKKYIVPDEIKKIKIETSEFIPEKFPEDEDYIKYYFNIGDNQWHQIKPYNLNQEDEVPTTYVLNSHEFDELRDKNYEYLETEHQPQSIQFKIEISRPEELNRLTPEITHFKSSILT